MWEFDESFAFQADFGMPNSTNKYWFCRQYRVSGLFWQECRRDEIWEFDESFAFQAHFGTPEHIEKTMILLTATCFLIFYHNIEQLTDWTDCRVCNSWLFRLQNPWKNVDFVDCIMFQARFGNLLPLAGCRRWKAAGVIDWVDWTEQRDWGCRNRCMLS